MEHNWKLVLFTAVLVVASFAANACTCPPPPPAKEAARRSDRVFLGTVLSIETHESTELSMWIKDRIEDLGEVLGQNWRRNYDRDFWLEVTFEISENFKGAATNTVIVATGWGGGDCGAPVEVGGTYLVFARHLKDRNEYVTGSCDGTGEAKRRRAELADLRRGI